MNDNCTGEEVNELMEAIRLGCHDDIVVEFMEENILHLENDGQPDLPDEKAMVIYKKLLPLSRPACFLVKPSYWKRIAAAASVIIGLGLYAYLFSGGENKNAVLSSVIPKIVETDVAPGTDGAMLTLADGSHIFLDSSNNGITVAQGATVIKNLNGSIIYTAKDSGSAVMYNTMTTPKARTFQLTLADGSRVWLNAESSITYPTHFPGKERCVIISGEAYFEIAGDPERKFIVRAGDITTEVLGTHFNINTYKEESLQKVTLLEGSVKITAGASDLVITPGTQAVFSQGKLKVNNSVDVEQVVAWKNGAFTFRQTDIGEVLRQLSRWYDVEIIYPDGIFHKLVSGSMGRDLNLTEVMQVLKGLGVKSKIEEGKLYVSQY
ncbi:FecR family protein [Agriterribacter sp.]|uniref:FecR family protein n=1 Tax=Agriterribacter sp. TaxID=2821509 RepID=UPI002C57131C|nr:FecR domain-containing protein [Agriterribacter sp.]HTN07424.1 FecR domain-containing protein [Agriterribacter sp.]